MNIMYGSTQQLVKKMLKKAENFVILQNISALRHPKYIFDIEKH